VIVKRITQLEVELYGGKLETWIPVSLYLVSDMDIRSSDGHLRCHVGGDVSVVEINSGCDL
jgi:hypothetical protein